MRPRIAPLAPGEELTDSEIFLALHSRTASPVRPVAPARPSVVVAPAPPVPPAVPAAPNASIAVPPRAFRRAAAPERPHSPGAAAALEAEIDRCTDRRHVARLAVHLARAYANAATLFVVQRGVIQGVWGAGIAHAGAGVLFPSDGSGPFEDAIESGEPVRGPAPQDGLAGRILHTLGRADAQEIAILPIAIRGRVVALLYADNGVEALGDASVAALGAIGARVARAYERIILARKRLEGFRGYTSAA